jgi:K+-transporting ATPase KdpF subunit
LESSLIPPGANSWAIFCFWPWGSAFSAFSPPTQTFARGCDAMADLILGGAVAALLFAYLMAALLAPERF